MLSLAVNEFIDANEGDNLTVELHEEAQRHFNRLKEAGQELLAEVSVMTTGIAKECVSEASDYLELLSHDNINNPVSEDVQHLNRCLQLETGEVGQ